MAKVVRGRFTAEYDDDFVVFLIGLRINRPWKLRKWLPVFVAMPKMLRELEQHPEKGLLASKVAAGAQHLSDGVGGPESLLVVVPEQTRVPSRVGLERRRHRSHRAAHTPPREFLCLFRVLDVSRRTRTRP